LEINPRFPSWVYMASACGINLPERMVKFLLSNEDKFPNEYKSGKIMIRYTAEIIKDIADFEKITTLGELENNPVKE
jgi:carbamoyl-phosphate synthase large subunit